ncbi:inovirus Gp2 family protein [Kosakonia sp. R1.Fl]|uniref:inovirus Gp2 family protein n=1 Tax=Kosakonia sp. R1.Fl TaxID=2928706 RepID=UPI00201E74BF|nr:inovirus Gp2 family protein [Kosakonia sp. R1.Fl]MCL6742291.1 inovirus Gp2 family protein [Kosakonia sp. R1.Fl]
MFSSLSLNYAHAPFNKHYIHRITQVVAKSLSNYPRTTVVMLILRLPEYRDNGDSISTLVNLDDGLMSRFTNSIRQKIIAQTRRKEKNGIRVHPTTLRYLWVREVCINGKKHYHAALLVNTQRFHSLGGFNQKAGNLGSFIEEAWLSALDLVGYPEYRTLVHFPKSPLYYLDAKAPDFHEQFQSLMFRLSYFAKEHSKCYSKEERSFGCSQY